MEGAPSAQESMPASPLHGTETILLAEDHDSIREMVRESLVNYGYRFYPPKMVNRRCAFASAKSPIWPFSIWSSLNSLAPPQP
jgi:hypothetical protein